MRSRETNKIPTSPVFPQKHSIIKTDLISFSSSDIPLTSQGWPCFPPCTFLSHLTHFSPQVEQLLSLEKSGYVCFSDYHTGFTGRFNIYDLVLEKPFFKGWNHLDCIICQLLCDPLSPPSFPPSLLALQQKIWKRGMYDPASRRCAFYCLQKVKSEDSIWPPREDSRAICRKFSICTKRWQQLNIFLQNNFLCCLTFLLRPRRSTKPFPSTFHKW